MTELEGFEIFAPSKGKPLFICTGEKAVRICADAYKALGKPQYVNVFLDDVKKRILIKVSEKSFDNALKVVKHSGGMNMTICYKDLAKKVSAMYGKGNRVYGHIVSEDMIIFDRSTE